MAEPFIDPSEEPDPICANCASLQGDIDGKWICINRLSGVGNTAPENDCVQFFPDPKRWPDADHD